MGFKRVVIIGMLLSSIVGCSKGVDKNDADKPKEVINEGVSPDIKKDTTEVVNNKEVEENKTEEIDDGGKSTNKVQTNKNKVESAKKDSKDKVISVKGVDKSKNMKKKSSDPCVSCEVVIKSSVIDDYKIRLTLENTSDGKLEIKFPTSQEYDFKIKGSKGEIFYSYSQSKSFSQVEKKKVLELGESLHYDIDLRDIFVNNMLPKGSYVVELFINGYVGVKDLRGTLTFVTINHE